MLFCSVHDDDDEEDRRNMRIIVINVDFLNCGSLTTHFPKYEKGH